MNMEEYAGLEMDTSDFERLWEYASLRFDSDQSLRDVLGVTRQTVHNIKTGNTNTVNIEMFSQLYSISEADSLYKLPGLEDPVGTDLVSEEEHPRNDLIWYDLDSQYRQYLFSRVDNVPEDSDLAMKTIQNLGSEEADHMVRQEIYDKCLQQVSEQFRRRFSPENSVKVVNNSNLPQYRDKTILRSPLLSERELKLVGAGGPTVLSFIEEIEEATDHAKNNRKGATTAIAKKGAEFYDFFMNIEEDERRSNFKISEVLDIGNRAAGQLLTALDSLDALNYIESWTNDIYEVEDIEVLKDYERFFRLSQQI